jgi:hypothetical protein
MRKRSLLQPAPPPATSWHCRHALAAIVAPDQPFKPVFTGPPQPPDFKDIANGPGVTAATLQRHLSSLPAVPRRPSMANPELTPKQLRDVTAFILSLRDKPAAPAQ